MRKTSEESTPYIDWNFQEAIERDLGHKVINWNNPENGKLFTSNTDCDRPNNSNCTDSTYGADSADSWIGLLFLDDHPSMVALTPISEDSENEVEITVKARKGRLVLFSAVRWSFSIEPVTTESKAILCFRFQVSRRPLGPDYWHILQRQQTTQTLPCFPPDLCQAIIQEAEDQQWTTQRHKQFPTTDIPVKTLEKTRDRIYPLVQGQIFEWFERYFGFPKSEMYINDLFVVKYSEEGQRKLRLHRDVTTISFNVLLNETEDFEGGGTYFGWNGKIESNRKGHVLLHSGALFHAGQEITKGTRYIMVGFVGLRSDRLNGDLRKEIQKRVVSDTEMLRNLLLY